MSISRDKKPEPRIPLYQRGKPPGRTRSANSKPEPRPGRMGQSPARTEKDEVAREA